MVQEYLDKLNIAADHINSTLTQSPRIGVILGSGLSNTLNSLQDAQSYSWSELPYFPTPSVESHRGIWEFGVEAHNRVLVQRGRVHYYEGYAMDEILFPIRVMHLLGISTVIITNAAGAINESFHVGEFVVISDHINMMTESPLRGRSSKVLGERFVSLNDAYSIELRAIGKQAAEQNGLTLNEGIYIATPGPMFETPAEIRAYRAMGADLVGMSNVPEVIGARHLGIEVLGISCVTNMAAGVAGSPPPNHLEVLEVTQNREETLSKLLSTILKLM